MGTVSDVTAEFGTLTVGGTGGYQVIPDTSTITAMTIMGGSSDFEVSGTDIIQQQVGHTTTAVVLTINVDFADLVSSSFNLTIQPFVGHTARTTSEYIDAGELSTLAYGHIIGFRRGDYNTAQADQRLARTTEFVGTFNGSNHVVMRNCLGESATIHRMDIRNSNDINPAFRIDGLTFERPMLPGGQNFEPGINLAGGAGTSWNMIVENCEGLSDPSFTGTGGIHTFLRASNGVRDVTVRNCNIHDVFNALNFQNSSNLDILGNDITDCWGDATFISAPETSLGGVAGEVNYNWNTATGMRPITADQHQDFFQYFGNSRTEVDNIVCRGNSHFGQGLEGAEVITNQGFLIRGADRIYGVILEFNRYVGGAFIGIQVENCVRPIIQGNSIINSRDNTTQTTFIRIASCFHSVIRYNIFPLYSPTNDNVSNPTPAEVTAINTIQTFSDQADYDAIFADIPPSGDEITNSDVQLAIVSNSAPDLETPVHGAHQDLGSQASQTFSTATYAALASGPFLYNSADSATTENDYTASVETNATDGTIFMVVTESDTAPTPAQIVAGQDNTGTAAADSNNDTVTARGVYNFSGSTLTAATAYYTHFVWRSADTLTFSDVWTSDGFATVGTLGPNNVVEDDGTAYLTAASLTGVDNNQTQWYYFGIHWFDAADTIQALFRIDATGASDTRLRRFTNNFLQLRYYQIPSGGGGDVQGNVVLGTALPINEYVAIMASFDSAGQVSVAIDSATTGFVSDSGAPLAGSFARLVGETELFHSDGGSVFGGQTRGQTFGYGAAPDWSSQAVRNGFYRSDTFEMTDLSAAPGTTAWRLTGDFNAYRSGTNEGTGGDFAATNPTGFTGTASTLPVISSPVDDANGQTGFTASFSTTGTDGTGFVSVTQSTTTPSAAQIAAGQDHTGAAADATDSTAVAAAGTVNFSGSGLTSGTQYYAHFVHRNAALNFSNTISGDGFTTESPAMANEVIDDGTAYLTRATSLAGIDNLQTQWYYFGVHWFDDLGATRNLFRIDAPGGSDSRFRRFNNNRFQLRHYQIPSGGGSDVRVDPVLLTDVPANEFVATMVSYDSAGDIVVAMDSSTTGFVSVTGTPLAGAFGRLVGTVEVFHSSGGSILDGRTQGQVMGYGAAPDWSSSTVRDTFYDSTTYAPTDFSSAPGTKGWQFTGNAAAYQAGTNEGTGGVFAVTNPSGFSDAGTPSQDFAVDTFNPATTTAEFNQNFDFSVDTFNPATTTAVLTGGDAPPESLRRLNVTGVFTADGVSLDTVTNSATVFITGSFVGTVNVQARTEAGNWVNVHEFTGVGSEAISFARARPVRLNATVTSGTVEYSVETAVDFLDER